MDAKQFERDVARAYALKRQIKALQDEYDEILGQYTFEREQTIPAGRFGLQVSPTRRFDAATASRNLPADKLALTMVTKPDSTRAKKVLTEDEYRLTQKEYGWTKKIIEYREDED